MALLDLGGIIVQGLLHLQGGGHSAAGGILVGDGGAEQRHDAVAPELGDRALVAVDGVHH